MWLQAQISRWSYIIMAAVFALSTPLGVAIGLGVQSTYSEKSPTALGVQGVFDSVAAGALLDHSPCPAMPLQKLATYHLLADSANSAAWESAKAQARLGRTSMCRVLLILGNRAGCTS